ncbi:MAG: hypothetical protein E7016_01715 [Alphaproteobacteria bacterium]|nr:hypothetical protein [Alphaproteobacteria bacterium]
MRKYFLLSAVALLATSTANATTDYAEVTAKATIEVATEFTCDEINWGTIVVKANNPDFTLYTDSLETPEILSITDYNLNGTCYKNGTPYNGEFEGSTTLKNANGDELGTYASWTTDYPFHSVLSIPANVKAGEYTGAFTVSVTY